MGKRPRSEVCVLLDSRTTERVRGIRRQNNAQRLCRSAFGESGMVQLPGKNNMKEVWVLFGTYAYDSDYQVGVVIGTEAFANECLKKIKADNEGEYQDYSMERAEKVFEEE